MAEKKLTYRELQKKAKELGLKATGKYNVLAERISDAKKEEQEVKAETKVPKQEQQFEPKVNRFGKTPEQKKKDDEAYAALAACGRI